MQSERNGDKTEIDEDESITLLRTAISLDYDYSAGQSASRFLRAIKNGKLLGQRCPVDGRVYFPSRGSCPQHAVTFAKNGYLIDSGVHNGLWVSSVL